MLVQQIHLEDGVIKIKAMTIGLSPEYNYPGTFEKWREDNTRFASNHGASLITRTIMKQFDADYIDDFSDIPMLKNKYDTCIMALSTHAHPRRDLSRYTELLEKLEMRVVIISLGIQDYINKSGESYELHSSVKKLLKIASEASEWIGVRGPYTASVVRENGFNNVLPIGCPSVFWHMKEDFEINTKEKYKKPLVVYHKTIVKENYQLIKDLDWLGQDFQDQAMFTDTVLNDDQLMIMENRFYNSLDNKEQVLLSLKENGIFHLSFDEWFKEISNHDFIFGPRLHGNIAALINGIPAVFLVRDLRIREMVEVFDFPFFYYSNLKNKTLESIVNQANYDKFKETYRKRYKNYLSFLNENKLGLVDV